MRARPEGAKQLGKLFTIVGLSGSEFEMLYGAQSAAFNVDRLHYMVRTELDADPGMIMSRYLSVPKGR